MDKKNLAYLAYTYEKDMDSALRAVPGKNTFYMTDHEFLDLFKEAEEKASVHEAIAEQILAEEEILTKPLETKLSEPIIAETSEELNNLDYVSELKENLLSPKVFSAEHWNYVKQCADKIKEEKIFLKNILTEGTVYAELIPYCVNHSDPEEHFTELIYGLWGLGRIISKRSENEEPVKFVSLNTATNVIGRLALRNHKGLRIIIEGLFRDAKEDLMKVEKGKSRTIYNLGSIVYKKGKPAFDSMLTTFKGVAPEHTQIKAISAIISAYQDELFKKYL